MARITGLTGFPEWLPPQRLIEQRLIDVLRDTFELHGFSGIETRAVEPVDFLLRKGEIDKEVYGVRRIHADDDEQHAMALHYDLTVPFSRYVLENAGRLDFPFKRYQIQKAWRGERPQFGRFREFVQADADIVDRDSLSPHFDAEIVLLVVDIFARLGFGAATVRINNRKLAEGFFHGLGIADPSAVLRAIDKLDKVGPAKVRTMLLADIAEAQADACLALAQISGADSSVLQRVHALGVEHPLLEQGLADLGSLLDAVAPHATGAVIADLKVARGLDYYTGTVFETELAGFETLGSVCSGGRYDELASDHKSSYPGVGLSVGVSRIMAIVDRDATIGITRGVPTAVLVAVIDEQQRTASNVVAGQLRSRGIATEVSPSAAKLGKQIRYADRRGIPFVWFAENDAHQVKDIRSGEQAAANPATWTPPEHDLRPRLVRSTTARSDS